MSLMSRMCPLIAAALLSLGASVLVSAAEVSDAQREAAELKIEELKSRLKLTAEQQAQLAPLVKARNAKLKELRAQRAGDGSRRGRRAMLKDARSIQEEFNQQLRPILTQEQMKEWQAIRAEVRATAKERWHERR